MNRLHPDGVCEGVLHRSCTAWIYAVGVEGRNSGYTQDCKSNEGARFWGFGRPLLHNNSYTISMCLGAIKAGIAI
jgi:hypothetical protein